MHRTALDSLLQRAAFPVVVYEASEENRGGAFLRKGAFVKMHT